jgi:thiol-disulfide isomerase/thioredoxin
VTRVTTIFLFIAVMLAAGAVMAQDYSMKSFNTQYQALSDDAALVNLCKEFLTKTDDIDVARDVENSFRDLDGDAALAFVREMSQKDPKSIKFKYLYGRLTTDKLEQLKIGRELIAMDPKFTYGYRLVVATYSEYLFKGSKDATEAEALKAELPKDTAVITALINLEPNKDYPLQFRYNYQMYQKDLPAALETLNKAHAANMSWPTGFDFANHYALMGRFDDAKKAVVDEVTARVEKGGWPADQKDQIIAEYYNGALSTAKAYKPQIDFILSGAPKDSGAFYNLACLYALSGDKDNAFTYLTKAAETGWERAEWTKSDEDLVTLHSDPRWNSVMATYQANWDKGKDARKTAALAEKTEKDAPDWSLMDKDGKQVKLSELKGKVVVLDFWATWCVWCRRAMPMIDEFVKTHAKPGVQVYSIQVFEKGHEKARRFMKEKGYAMTLLFGNEDIPKAYGFQGIPFICVIDKAGKMRFVENGYSDDLLDKLQYWTEDLLAATPK